MDKYTLPKNVVIDGVVCEFDSDYRSILKIFEVLKDPDLLEQERILIALDLFYKDNSYTINLQESTVQMMEFLSGGSEYESSNTPSQKPLYDWEQDFKIIVAPVNKVLGTDVRGLEYLHWWTFLSAFMEIGECTFSTFVGIRDKLNKNKKLEKHEETIYRENRDRIVLKRKYDSTTQALMDEILGKGV
jgi:hypothetical protein